jgi:hypothetical protein
MPGAASADARSGFAGGVIAAGSTAALRAATPRDGLLCAAQTSGIATAPRGDSITATGNGRTVPNKKRGA